jgi:sugar phosphate permease
MLLSKRFHYAWVIATVTFFVLMVAAGVRTVPQVLIKPLEQEFAWSRSDISFAIAISILWFGLGGPLAGGFIDTFGVRKVIVGGLLLISIGLALTLTTTTLWQLHLYWGVVVGIGTGAIANVLGAVVAQRWFTKYRGVIIGLLGAASATGQLIFLPNFISITEANGWRGAILAAAIATGVMALPALLFMRNRPEDINLKPVGDDSPADPTPRTAPNHLDRRTPLREAVRTLDFWLLAGSFFVCGYTTNGLIGTHLLPHAIEHGFDSGAAASAISLMGLMNIVGTLTSGWLSDRYDNRVLLMCYYGFRALSIAFLPFVVDMLGFFAFAVIYGLDWIATVPPTINLTAKRFGRGSVGVLYGWIFFSHMAGAALAAYIGGVMRDSFGDYTVAFFTAAILGFIAAGFSISIERVRFSATPLQADL